jgi:hypothetical protein
MTTKFCIKKNPTSFMNPWLCRMAPGNHMPGTLVYSHMDHMTAGVTTLEVFPSIESAKTFISENPEMCDEQNVICEVKMESGKMEMVPV